MTALEVRKPVGEYRDGSEDELLGIISGATDRSITSEELRAAIHDWPTRYHLSPLRANLLRPLSLPAGARILEVGAGTGVNSRWLGEQGYEVVAVEGSLARAEIAAERCAELERVRVLCGGADEVDPEIDGLFDAVLLIGVLEYATTGGLPGAEALLASCARLLAPGGLLVLAIENQLGLQYLSGAPEDHWSLPGVGVEGYLQPGPRTYSRARLGSLLAGAGLGHQRWLYPYPDYKLPVSVLAEPLYSLPHPALTPATVTSLARQLRSSHHGTWPSPFDLALAHTSLVEGGLGPDVANSFLVVAGGDAGTVASAVPEGVLAWLLNDERRGRWARHRTLELAGGELQLVTDGGSIDRREGWLTQRSPATQPFTPGTDLGQLAFEACSRHDPAALDDVLARWVAELDRGRTTEAGEPHPFRRPGSTVWLTPGHLDVDLGNFVVGPDGALTYIDDEWGTVGAIERDLVCVRALWHLARSCIARGVAPGGGPTDTADELAVALARRAGLDVDASTVEAWKDAERQLQALAIGSRPELVEGWLGGGTATVAEVVAAAGAPVDRQRDALSAAVAEAGARAAELAATQAQLGAVQADLDATRATLAALDQGGKAHLKAAARAAVTRVRPRATRPSSPAEGPSDAELVAGLRAEIRTTLARHLDLDAPVGFLNFPNHRNAGDSALWLAGEQLLGELTGGVRYRCTSRTFDRARFERAVGDGPIVLNAGGNLGDLYPEGQQRLREEVLATFPGRPVVQLPQSIHFQDPANLERMRRLVGEHGATTILCRDQASLELARSSFDAVVDHCPDLALAGPVLRPAADPGVDVLWLSRTDPEHRHDAPVGQPGVEVVDWLEPLPGEPRWPGRRRAAFELNLRLVGTTGPVPHPGSLASTLAAATFGPLARAWTQRGVDILGRGRVVVTDRLHGHLLAFLAGIPSVVLDNSYGKVHGVVALTTASSPLTHLAGSSDEALAMARDLVR
jgi:exopolysaccharide biosynthesis predicted pyruvyltransferase EpsI/SAM-dependent methyltransferase